MDLMLTGKNVLITGGSKGIGKACALLFAEEGANVAVAARTQDTLDEAAAEIEAAGPGAVTSVAGDMTRWEDVPRVVGEALSALEASTCSSPALGVLPQG